jgi:hypothetical protein
MSVANPKVATLLKELTYEERWTQTDFSKRAGIIALMPAYIQEQHAWRANNKKPISKAVNIESFTMKTPFGDQILFKSTELVLESGKRQCLYGANSTGKTLFQQHVGRQDQGLPETLARAPLQGVGTA